MWACTLGVPISWTARTTTATRLILAGAGLALLSGVGLAAGVRDHTRLKGPPAAVSETQAGELSLAMGAVAVRPIQTLVRLRAVRTSAQRIEATASGPEGALLLAGQRARVFTLRSRSQMAQARIERVTMRGGELHVQVLLAAPKDASSGEFLVEVVVERGKFLSVPNDALIEEGTHRNVYVRNADGEFEARQVEVGIQGETYTVVTSGLQAGEQVVTTGSFFIDADQKMKGGG